ncbi:hypothetical protein QQG55_25425 [Brugia pahangi]|uniref:Uncharacterized protein n=1 Tax=Brugia pahangi TaxID=6280 RepID=A0A0N4TVY1_BRUPA|nr:unnamed protein product [Brugia pahangi]
MISRRHAFACKQVLAAKYLWQRDGFIAGQSEICWSVFPCRCLGDIAKLGWSKVQLGLYSTSLLRSASAPGLRYGSMKNY